MRIVLDYEIYTQPIIKYHVYYGIFSITKLPLIEEPHLRSLKRYKTDLLLEEIRYLKKKA